jgi:Domain of unknown function (DUF4372)
MSHCNTIFHQMLKLIPRLHFAKLEAEHSTGRKARSFTRWSQLVAPVLHATHGPNSVCGAVSPA